MANRRFHSILSFAQLDLSGAIQSSTSHLLQKRNQVDDSRNADYHLRIGSAARRPGYEQVGYTVQSGKDGQALHVYKYGQNNKLMVGINDSGDTQTTIQFLDSGGYWTLIPSTNIAPSTRMHPVDYLDESYWVGSAPGTDTYMTPLNIDSTLIPSSTRNVYGMPGCKYLVEFQGALYAINCNVGGVKYRDRAYRSSQPTGIVTFVKSDQIGLKQQLQLDPDGARYLKAGMSIDIYSAGTNSLQVSGITIISVDKNNDRISFAPTQINVKDNDEIWLNGRKGKLSILWNTDYPNPEDADWLRVPPGTDEIPDFTGVGKNTNRLLLFTRNSFQTFDGNNLVVVSNSIGCVAHETIRNIGQWTFWLHTSGIWGYNVATGQLQRISRPIQKYINALVQTNLVKASATAFGSIYKLAVGEINDLDSVTTSTSTSSTSTSSTSSSTSSTSTSSTSVSSTSSSSSISSTSASTSSTSVSTSSTSTSSTSASTSSTSKSTSTSSTSTSMSTSSTTTQTTPSTKKVIRIIYDFDMNALWAEEHKREFRFQINHTMNGYTKPYFIDETGRVFRDETTDKDHQDTIPMYIRTGRNNMGTELLKIFTGCYVESEAARVAQVKVSIDNGEWLNVGQLDVNSKVIAFPMGLRGRDIKYELTWNDIGEAPFVDGVVTYYSLEETVHGYTATV